MKVSALDGEISVAIPLKQGQVFNCKRVSWCSITHGRNPFAAGTSFQLHLYQLNGQVQRSQSLCSRDKFSIPVCAVGASRRPSQSLCSRDKFSIARGVFPPCFQSVVKGVSNFFPRGKVEPSGIVFLRVFHGAYCSGFRGGFQ